MLFSVGGQSQQSRSQHGEGPGTRWKADGAAGHRGRTGRRAVLPPRLGWHVCRIVAPGPLRKLGGLLLVSHRRARTGAQGQRRHGRAQGRGPAGPEAAAPRPESAGRLCVFGRAREDRTRAETKTNVYKPAKREP